MKESITDKEKKEQGSDGNKDVELEHAVTQASTEEGKV